MPCQVAHRPDIEEAIREDFPDLVGVRLVVFHGHQAARHQKPARHRVDDPDGIQPVLTTKQGLSRIVTHLHREPATQACGNVGRVRHHDIDPSIKIMESLRHIFLAAVHPKAIKVP